MLECEVCQREATSVGKYSLCSIHSEMLEEYEEFVPWFRKVRARLDEIRYEFREVLKKKSYLGGLADTIPPKRIDPIADPATYKDFKRSLTSSDKNWDDNIKSRKIRTDAYGNKFTTYKDKRGVEQIMPDVPRELRKNKKWGRTKI